MSNGVNDFSKEEEKYHALTHGFGLLLAFIGTVALLLNAINSSALMLFSVSVYAFTLLTLYASSTIYHALTNIQLKKLFQTFDHVSIYLLIAGTYTPIVLLLLGNSYGYWLFGFEWSVAFFGIYMKFKYPQRFELLSLILYVVMGWAILSLLSPLKENLDATGMYLLVAGGVAYTSGVYFYVKDSKRNYHAIWHIFVLAGSIFHFFLVYTLTL